MYADDSAAGFRLDFSVDIYYLISMQSIDIRRGFLDYFAANGHRVVPSSPVIPQDDPTLLFTNAGMNQFKNVFIGLEKRDYSRAVSVQKCIRAGGKHNDLDQVGFTARHQTFFEMLGNFSFGDYFKAEAISFAWELVTKIYRLDPKRLYATVFKEDEEAEKLWRKIAPELKDRILRFGEKDNFWAMGDTGPCGPCSEIHFDRGDHIPGELNGEGDRYMEIWNLVFMQYNRDDSGNYTPLPKPSVDTGAGLERLCMVIQNVDSNYDTDLFRPLLEKIEQLSNREYKRSHEGIAHRVIADHTRALAFAIADNAIISNEGRGYVLRRILRRAARYGHQLGLTEPFIYSLVAPLAEKMGQVYPELISQRGRIELVIKSEEEQFNRTLGNGLARFEEIAGRATGAIRGEDVFKLYDTYGFPPDLTEIMAREKGLTIDWGGFEKELEEQRERSRAESKFKKITALDGAAKVRKPGVEKFLYDKSEMTTAILQGKVGDQTCQLILEQTPFYAESGGQVGDTGEISGEGFKVRVTDTLKINEEHVHIGEIIEGGFPEPLEGIEVKAAIDAERRADIQRNHTATHLLHKALRIVLGDHVSQSGSLVAPDRLRFDFSHFRSLTPEEIEGVERLVNEKIEADMPVTWQLMSFADAKKLGAVALFGEKYGEIVRVVKSGDFSMELCGGCHVAHTGDIGGIFIVSENGIAAGIRRIEAITGRQLERFKKTQAGLLERLELILRVPDEKQNEESIAELKTLRAEIHPRILAKNNLDMRSAELLDRMAKIEKQKSLSKIKAFEQQAAENAPVLELRSSLGTLLFHKIQNENAGDFLPCFDAIKAYNSSKYNGGITVVVSATTGQFAIHSPSYDSAEAVREIIVRSAGARGGGRPTIRGTLAVENIDKAISALREAFSK